MDVIRQIKADMLAARKAKQSSSLYALIKHLSSDMVQKIQKEYAEGIDNIVMRTDLGMRKGKMIAQGAHASLALTLANLEDTNENLAPVTGSLKLL